ncbi:MAG: hypothetical protein ACOCZA_01035, partial [Spirochaetota bacterium]
NQLFDTRCNREMVDVEQITDTNDEEFLRKYIERHIAFTGSRYAQHLMEIWEEILPLFVKVMPLDYRIALMKTEGVAEQVNNSERIEAGARS